MAHAVPFSSKEWTLTEKKVSCKLRSFDGKVANYKMWSERVKDHCKQCNQKFKMIFDMV